MRMLVWRPRYAEPASRLAPQCLLHRRLSDGVRAARLQIADDGRARVQGGDRAERRPVMLGEVDTGFTIWRRSQTQPRTLPF